MIVSICTNYSALKKRKAFALVNGEPPKTRSHNDGRGAAHVHVSGNNSLVVMTDDADIEDLGKATYVTLTSFEEIFGFRTPIAWEDGVATEWIETPAIQEMRDLYDSVYDRTPVVTAEGVYNPPKLWAIPAGESVDHLL